MSAQIVDVRWLMEATRLGPKSEAKAGQVLHFPAAAISQFQGQFASLHSIAQLAPNPLVFARDMASKTRTRGSWMTDPRARREHEMRAQLWDDYVAILEAPMPEAWARRRASAVKSEMSSLFNF